MLHIAICDDDNIICTQVESILINISISLDEKMEIDIFYSGESLYWNLLAEVNYDIIFLDIELKAINGVEVGRKIRDEMHNESTQFVYISGKESYAMELFDTRPLNFLIKPLQEIKIAQVIKKALQLATTENEFFEYKIGRTQSKVFVKDILFFESDGKRSGWLCRAKLMNFMGNCLKFRER